MYISQPYEVIGCSNRCKKSGLLNQFKSPIGAKWTFQIYEDPHEVAKASGKDNKWWKENSFMLFFGEKEGGL